MGAIVKPTASALQLAALTAENIRNSASQHAAQALQPVRLPRQMDSWRPLAPYSRAMAAAQAALREADGGRWAGEVGGGRGCGVGREEHRVLNRVWDQGQLCRRFYTTFFFKSTTCAVE